MHNTCLLYTSIFDARLPPPGQSAGRGALAVGFRPSGAPLPRLGGWGDRFHAHEGENPPDLADELFAYANERIQPLVSGLWRTELDL